MTPTADAALTPLDLEEIRQVAFRYALGVDRGDVELVRSCFAADGRIVAKAAGIPGAEDRDGVTEGAEAFRAFVESAHLAGKGLSRHLSLNHLIDGRGDAAHMTSYLVVVLAGIAPAAGVIITGTYDDELVRRDGRWLIRERLIVADSPTAEVRAAVTDPLMLIRLANDGGPYPTENL